VELRPASEADFEAELAVLDLAEGGLRARHGFAWKPPPLEAFAATHAHILATDPGRSWVAEEDGRVIAFTAAIARGETWFLSDLFVHPDHQGRGLGSRLLERAWGDGPARRATIADAIQPVSNAMYARRGLVPATPVLELGGVPQGIREPRVEPAEATAADLAALDAAAYGFDRAPDHAFWAGGLTGTVWHGDNGPVAYSYVSPGGRIGPLAGRDGSSAAAALEAELARLGERRASLDVPGSSRDVVEAALGAGLRITGPPGLLLLGPGLEPPRALAISGYWLL
jgi:GNAT superfamily N-acetyltransferase